MIWGDYHIHTTYSGCNGHATGTPETILKEATQKGLKQVGICDHGINHALYGTTPLRLKKLKSALDYLNSTQSQVRMLTGIEANIYSFDGDVDSDRLDRGALDLVVAGFHKMVWGKKLADGAELSFSQIFGVQTEQVKRKFTSAVVKAIKNNKIDILAHPGYGFPLDIAEVIKVATDYDVALEFNGKRILLSDEQLLQIAESKVRIVANSDAHDAKRVGEVGLPIETCKRLGIPLERIANFNGVLF